MIDFNQFSDHLAKKYDWIKFQLAHGATLYFWDGNEAVPIYSIDYISLWWNALTYNETDDWDNTKVISDVTINGKIGSVPICFEDSDMVKEYCREHMCK